MNYVVEFTSAKYFDLTIDGSPVEVNREIPLFFPWTLAYVLSVINSYALGYVFTAAIIDYATSSGVTGGDMHWLGNKPLFLIRRDDLYIYNLNGEILK